jgi:hypothetical protein
MELMFLCSPEAEVTKEHPMSRFDPNTYPDRLEFDAYAHRIRAKELGELFHAVGDWEKDRQHEIMSRLGKFATTTFSHLRRHSTH